MKNTFTFPNFLKFWFFISGFTIPDLSQLRARVMEMWTNPVTKKLLTTEERKTPECVILLLTALDQLVAYANKLMGNERKFFSHSSIEKGF